MRVCKIDGTWCCYTDYGEWWSLVEELENKLTKDTVELVERAPEHILTPAMERDYVFDSIAAKYNATDITVN